ncbi:flavin reductase (DIM6/NTAB) family NADH-FMN oxidoreductase RutF/DNA-binding transcriptional LysR family regulator [Nitrobacteraceae bacterium AZCC 2161]
MLRAQFLEGMSRAACTVSVVTTDGKGGRAGVTVSAMASVSADTPSLLVCIHRDSKAVSAIRENGVFCVNVLRDSEILISDTFGGRRKTTGDRFDCAKWDILASGAPAVANALAAFDCRLTHELLYGSHWILIGELTDIVVAQASSPLIYANRGYGVPMALPKWDSAPVTDEEHLSVGSLTAIGPFMLGQLLSSAAAAQPAMPIRITESDQPTLMAKLATGQLSVALTLDIDVGPEIGLQPLANLVPYVLLPSDHRLIGKSLSPEDLIGEPMILYDHITAASILECFSTMELAPIIRHRTASFETVRSLVGNGLGYAILWMKPSNAQTYDGRPLAAVPFTGKLKPLRLVLAYRDAAKLSSDVQRFVEHCKQGCQAFWPDA